MCGGRLLILKEDIGKKPGENSQFYCLASNAFSVLWLGTQRSLENIWMVEHVCFLLGSGGYHVAPGKGVIGFIWSIYSLLFLGP